MRKWAAAAFSQDVAPVGRGASKPGPPVRKRRKGSSGDAARAGETAVRAKRSLAGPAGRAWSRGTRKEWSVRWRPLRGERGERDERWRRGRRSKGRARRVAFFVCSRFQMGASAAARSLHASAVHPEPLGRLGMDGPGRGAASMRVEVGVLPRSAPAKTNAARTALSFALTWHRHRLALYVRCLHHGDRLLAARGGRRGGGGPWRRGRGRGGGRHAVRHAAPVWRLGGVPTTTSGGGGGGHGGGAAAIGGRGVAGALFHLSERHRVRWPGQAGAGVA